MIKYFCDLCGKEIRQEQRYIYTLPKQVPYEAISTWGEPIYTYEQLEDREVEICDVCRRKISYVLKDFVKEEN